MEIMMVAPALVILALAAGVPYIDIRKTCRAAQATGISIDQKAAYQGCVADENEAKQTLIRTWSKLSGANRQSCVDEATGLSPSYVEMLTCLEMRDGGKFTGGAGPNVPPPAVLPKAPGTPSAGSAPSVPPSVPMPSSTSPVTPGVRGAAPGAGVATPAPGTGAGGATN